MQYKASFYGNATQLIVPMIFQHCSLLLPTRPSQCNLFKGNSLIDTGATHTTIHEKIPIAMGMMPIGRVAVATPSHSYVEYNQYMMKLSFLDTKQFLDNFRVTATDVSFSNPSYPIHCLIGMDILRCGKLTYDGEQNKFDLVFPFFYV